MAKPNSTNLQSYVKGLTPAQQNECKKANKDIISSLPDQVLSHILSFLPTKVAVGTSVLSRRWRYTWTSIENLDFDDMLVCDYQKFESDRGSRKDLFMKFVSRVLFLRGDSIKKFCLKVSKLYLFCEHLKPWICSAIMHNVEELHLGDFNCIISLPQILFTCKTLKILKLRPGISLHMCESVCLPSLKVLHLQNLRFLNDASIGKILSGSPVLEELFIDRHPSDNTVNLNVKSSSLKTLAMHCVEIDHDVNDCCNRVVIDAPNLELLELKDYVSTEYDMKLLCPIVKATVDIEVNASIYIKNRHHLLTQICNAKALSLSARTLKAFVFLFIEEIGHFNNLTRLEVTPSGKGWLVLLKILRCTPNLEAFILHKDDKDRSSVTNLLILSFLEVESGPLLMLSSLERLELDNFKGDTVEMKMVEFFLKNATVLKKIRISSNASNSEEKLDILKKLTTFPRASSACQILFS